MLPSPICPARRRAVDVAMILCLGAASLAPLPAAAGRDGPLYEVHITNATYAQQFTPLLLVTHEASVRLFELGAAPSTGLATLAEEGNVAPLRAVLDADPKVNMTTAGTGLTNGGSTVTFTIQRPAAPRQAEPRRDADPDQRRIRRAGRGPAAGARQRHIHRTGLRRRQRGQRRDLRVHSRSRVHGVRRSGRRRQARRRRGLRARASWHPWRRRLRSGAIAPGSNPVAVIRITRVN